MPGIDSWQVPRSFDEVVKKYGEWTAMAIHLGAGRYTVMPPCADHRLRGFMQIISDLSHKPLNQIRVLDVACCEGHYGIELALHGAEVVAIEIRDTNLAKAHFVKEHLRLDNFKLYQDDIRNLSKEKYGIFDVVLCAGILYHLDVPDVFNFIKNVFEVCSHFAVFDTFISLSPRKSVEFDGKTYCGLEYTEHQKSATQEEKLQDLWSSVGNDHSFWLTQPSFCRLLNGVGFSSIFECLLPVWENRGRVDRKAYVAIKGKAPDLLSSPVTAQTAPFEIQENPKTQISSCQKPTNFFFKLAKEKLPQPLKNILKPVLRSLRLMRPDGTPVYLKKSLAGKNPKNGCSPSARPQ